MICACYVCHRTFEDATAAEIPDGMIALCPECCADPELGMNVLIASWVHRNIEAKVIDGQRMFRLRSEQNG